MGRALRAGSVLVVAFALIGLGACGGGDATTAEDAGSGGPSTSSGESTGAGNQGQGGGELSGEQTGAPGGTSGGAQPGVNGPQDDEREIRAALSDALASGDPELACRGSVTDAYVSRAYGSLEGCSRAQGPDAATELLDVGPIHLSARAATTTIHASGGSYAGEELTAELVLEGGAWKLDALRSNVEVGP